MSTQTKKGVGRKAGLTAYKASNRMQTNRRKKLERQVKLQPNNKNLTLALKIFVIVVALLKFHFGVLV